MKKILLIFLALIALGVVGLSFFKIPSPVAEVRKEVPIASQD